MGGGVAEGSYFDAMRSILADEFEISADTITLEARLFDDLNIDSIDAVDLLVRLQEMTGKHIPPEQFRQVSTIGDVVNILTTL